MSEHIEAPQESPIEVPSVEELSLPKEESFDEKLEKLLMACSNSDLVKCVEHAEREIQVRQFSALQQARVRLEIEQLKTDLEEQKKQIDEQLKQYQLMVTEQMQAAIKEQEDIEKVAEEDKKPQVIKKARVVKSKEPTERKAIVRKNTKKKLE